MSGRSGMPLGPRSGVSVKTEENRSFNMSAFSLRSSLGMPSFLIGEMPLLSHFLSFIGTYRSRGKRSTTEPQAPVLL